MPANADLAKWIMGALLAIVLALFGYGLDDNQQRIQRLEELSSMCLENNATARSDIRHIEQRLDGLDAKLGIMDDKLDRIYDVLRSP